MAHLEVQRKRSNPWWLWLLLAIIALAIIFWAAKGCNSTSGTVAATDSSAGTKAVAATQPDWNSVDFNSAKSTDADITDPDISVSGNDRYTIYTLGENILFASDSKTVQGSAEAKLKQVAAALAKRYKGASIGVYGSTDSEGSAEHNKTLGAERAGAVKDWLVQSGGLDASYISVQSLGENKPVASNATESGRQQNRNVSIVAFSNK